MNIIISALILVLGAFGGFTLNKNSAGSYSYDNGGSGYLSLGATNFPTSLDSLTNPSGTDSVATVSHSGQHSNANDAIEVIEAKLGIGASTAVSGTVFVGDGTGTSRWSTYATTTNVSTTALESTNILANGSSTLQNFTFVNATGTSATTTNFFSTTASSSNAFTASFNGAGLSSCTGQNSLQWDSGVFSCVASSGATLSSVSTTSAQDLATTTIRGIPFGKINRVAFMLATTSNQSIRICFNEDWGGCKQTTGYYAFSDTLDGGTLGGSNSQTYAQIRNTGAGTASVQMFGSFTFFNSTTSAKAASGQAFQYASSSVASSGTAEFHLFWASTTAAINSISLITNDPNLLIGKGSYIQVDVVEN